MYTYLANPLHKLLIAWRQEQLVLIPRAVSKQGSHAARYC